jgi:hypothetical protein
MPIGATLAWMMIAAKQMIISAERQPSGEQDTWARHQTLTDAAHWAAAQALRRQRLTVVRPPAEPDVPIRCLADHDDALGLDGGMA